MSNTFRNFTVLLCVVGITLILFTTAFLPRGETSAHASSNAITGYAWSDTIGWISLSGSGYGFSIESDGTLSGYAWSDNIGWISAESSDLNGCPSGTCSARFSGGALSGWLKALSAESSQSGSWDGWVSLSGSGYGPTLSAGDFSGYAWGSDVVGWVDFSLAHSDFQQCAAAYSCHADDLYSCDAETGHESLYQSCQFGCLGSACVPPPTPSATLTVRPSLVLSGGTTSVSWTTENMASCHVTDSLGDSWSGTSGGPHAAHVVTLVSFTLTCTGLDGSTVIKTAAAAPAPTFLEF